MTTNEVIVFVIFGLLGYWVVSFFLERRSQSQGWHRVLKVEANASIDEIRAAYQALMSQYDPDKIAALGAEVREVAERKSKEITAAYREAMRSRGVIA